MKRPLVIALIVLVLAAGGLGIYWLVQRGDLPDFVARPTMRVGQIQPTPGPVVAPTTIVAEAVVVPARYAALRMDASGAVTELPVVEGQQVAKGDVIARLESDAEVIAVAQAQAAVDQARATLAGLISGARSEELAVAQAAVDEAAANLTIIQEGARPEDIAEARAGVEEAQGYYATVAEGADAQALIAARADMANALAALTRAQRAFDQVSQRNDVGALPESAELQQATNNNEAAQARYAELEKGARPGALASAAAQVDKAQAALDRVQSGATAGEIAAATATVQRAQAEYNLIAAGTRPEEIAAAQAAVSSAETVLMQAQLALSQRALLAPFAGEVASLDLRLGQQISTSVAVAQIADTSTWLVETTDLTEINVVDVQVGDKVQVEIDALPGVVLEGTVTNIKPLGVNVQGDITYKATIRLDTSDARLRWNMTASVTIVP